MKMSGIYLIQSKAKSDRKYIGSSDDIWRRHGRHLRDLRKHKHHSIKLQNHFNKYGESDLQFSLLLGCNTTDLIKIEQYFIDSYNPYFNICKNAGSSLGCKQSKETKQKMHIIQLNRSKEQSMKIGAHQNVAIRQFNQFGEHIMDWESLTTASKSLGIGSTSISNCVCGLTKNAGGFIWKYKVA